MNRNAIGSTRAAHVGDGHVSPPLLVSHLQLGDDVFRLSDFDGWREAESISRLSGDIELVNSLRFRGFSLKDPLYQLFTTALAEYGFSVLRAWMFKGLIFAKCSAHLSLRPYLQDCPRDFVFSHDQDFLAVDAVGEALVVFRRDVLVPGVWNPEKGASLKTFFIGQALYQFIKLLKEWWRSELKPGREDPYEPGDCMSVSQGPADIAIGKDEIRNALAALGSPLREILVLSADGYRQTEIAEILQISVKTIESHLYRHRRALGAVRS